MATPVCVWYLDDIGGESAWETDCHHTFEFNDDGPVENGFKFCPYCGVALAAARSSEVS